MTHLLTVRALHSRPILWLWTLLTHVAELIAITALHHLLLLAIFGPVTLLPAVAAYIWLTRRAVLREMSGYRIEWSANIPIETNSDLVDLLSPQLRHSTFSGLGGSGHSLAMCSVDPQFLHARGPRGSFLGCKQSRALCPSSLQLAHEMTIFSGSCFSSGHFFEP